MKKPSTSIINQLYNELFVDSSFHVYWLDEDSQYLGCNHRYCDFIMLKNQAGLLGKKSSNFLLNLGIRTENVNLRNETF